MRSSLLALAAVAGVTTSVHADDGEQCGLEDPAVAESAPAVPERAADRRSDGEWGPLVRRDRSLARERVGHGAGGGALSGKTVYVSAGHGWVWDPGLGRWRTQRGNTNAIVEDFVSAETVSQHLVPYLRDLGAYVVPVREGSMQREIAMLDDAEAGFAITGPAAPAAIAEGWTRPPDPIPDGRNPFADGGSTELATATDGGSEARWVLEVPADGDYEVYVAWVQAADRASDAHYVVHHAGGDSEFRVDQRRHGSTWVLLGQFHFAAGADAERGAISLRNDSADPGSVVSADAIRLGGGLGHIDRGGGASARPAFEDGARYAAQWNGAPATVWDYTSDDGSDDVGTRSRFSAWDHEDGEDAVYVAWHTNAPNPARGTSSFAYGPEAFGDLSQFTGVAGSLQLMDAIHDELIADLRAAWDPAWQDRGQHTAYFGEVNPSHNPEMPATLIEVGFHDTPADADALRDPRFRRLAARAIAHGIARYFASRDGAPLTLPPEPPAAARMTQTADGVTLAWAAPEADPAGGDASAAYRVYLSRDGRAFDDGREVTGTSLAIDDAELDGAPLFARITAVNAGGESRPSPVVGAAPAPGGQARVLVVAAFSRLDGAMLIDEDLGFASLGIVDRGPEDRINDESHAARHGLAIAAAGYSFDVVTLESVRRGEIDVTVYPVISWVAGEELAPLDDTDRAALGGYLDIGTGVLLVSGTDVARALAAGAGDAPAFLDRLGVALVADDAGTYAAAGTAGSAFDGLAVTFDDGGPGGYDADAADTLAAVGDGAVALAYDSGAGAAIAGPRSLVLGFPIETVAGADARTELMRRALSSFGIEPDPPPLPDDDAGAGCCSAGPRPDASALLLLVLVAYLLTPRPRGSNLGDPWPKQQASSTPRRSRARSPRSPASTSAATRRR